MTLLEQMIAGSKDQSESTAKQPAVTSAPAENTGIQTSRKQQSLLQKMSSISFEAGPNRKDVLNFTNQLAVMIRAGISLPEALGSIGSQIEKKKFRSVIIDLKNNYIKRYSSPSLKHFLQLYIESF